MAVYYKFKSAKDFDSITIDGHFITVASLKEKIFESKHLGRGTDFDLMVSNAQTNEEYSDEAMLIPKNTSVLVRRIPGRPRMPIVTERAEPKVVENKVEEDIPNKSSIPNADPSAMKFPDESEWDEFGNDLYTIPEAPSMPSGSMVQDSSLSNRVDEDTKIKALMDTTSLEWQHQGTDVFGTGRGFGSGMGGGRMMSGRAFGRGIFERKTPPQGYVCHRCKIPGHFIQHCPTNGDPNFDIRRVKPPTGIPKSMLMATPDGSYALPSGAVAVLKPNEAVFEKEIEGLPSSRLFCELPPELRCPLCKEVMKDAVLTSKCCFGSFCDKCIRDHIITKSMCVCGASNILADDLLPNKTVRETIKRILETTTSSAENVGSLLQVQDMESARHTPKIPSPTLSAPAKEEERALPSRKEVQKDEVLVTKKFMNESDVIPQETQEKSKTAKNVDMSEATLDSMNAKEPMSQGSAPLVEEEVQQKVSSDPGKKKKKKKVRSAANDMQWRATQDLGTEFMVPFPPTAYNNPYVTTGMQWGMENYVAPFASHSIPYMSGYNANPFDIPYGGIIPQDPYAAHAYMMPILPQRDLAELAMGSSGAPPPIMNREDLKSRKTDSRRKHELDWQRHGERETSKETGGGREMSSSADVSSIKSKPRPASKAASAERGERNSSLHRPQDRSKPSYSRRSPPPPPKRSELEAESLTDDGKGEGKKKGSVFSRISYPERLEASGKKRKAEPSSSEPINGFKEQKASPVHSRRSAVLHDPESSDDERHFKRRSTSRALQDARVEDWEDESRPSKGSRDRDRNSGREYYDRVKHR